MSVFQVDIDAQGKENEKGQKVIEKRLTYYTDNGELTSSFPLDHQQIASLKQQSGSISLRSSDNLVIDQNQTLNQENSNQVEEAVQQQDQENQELIENSQEEQTQKGCRWKKRVCQITFVLLLAGIIIFIVLERHKIKT